MILIKTPEEIEIMAEGGKILAEIMRKLEKEVKPGIATKDLNRLAEELVLRAGAKCSFKGYWDDWSIIPFPSCLCVSINEEIVHGVPSGRILKEGDMVSLDSGLLYKNFHSDMAITLIAGKRAAPESVRLIKAVEKSLEIGIKKVRPGITFNDVGKAIQEHLESRGFDVIRDLCGHGIGRQLHEKPEIPNYDTGGKSLEIKQGMVFCLEPMAAMGGWKIKRTKASHGYQTADNSLSAHFEHTIAVTKHGCRVLTK